MNQMSFADNGFPFTKAEQKIIDYIYQNQSTVHVLSIGQLSEAVGLSEATISRFVKHAGFRNFKEFKTDLLRQMDLESPADKMTATLAQNSLSEWAFFLKRQQYCIEKTIDHINGEELAAAVEAMINAKHIYIHAKGAASALSHLLAFRLSRFGLHTTILPQAGSEIFEKLVHIKQGDVVVLFGFQKVSREARVILKHRREIPYQTILLSSKMYDHEDNRGDLNLYVYRGEAKEYHSLTAPAAVIDAIIIMTAAKLSDQAVERLSALHRLKEEYQEDIPR